MLNIEQLNESYNPYIMLELIKTRIETGKLVGIERLFYNEEWYESKRKLIDIFMERIRQGNYDYISLVGNGEIPNSLHFLQYFYKALPPVDRYKITIDTYINNGYNFPKNLIIGLKKIKPLDYLADLPVEYSDIETLTVYRASKTCPDGKLANEISWTICREVAEWFLARYVHNNVDAYLYIGNIRKQDIIAFTNEREEYEVIQHGAVKNISVLDMDNEEL